MTVSEKSTAWGAEVVATLRAAGLRVHFDDGDEKVGAKIREAHAHKPVWQVVVGERDAENSTVSVKSRDADLGAMPLAAFRDHALVESRRPFG